MTLLIGAPERRVPERRYVLDVVFSEWLGLDYELRFHDQPEVSIRLAEDDDSKTLVVPDLLLSIGDDAWLTERAMPSLPLRRLEPDPTDARHGPSSRPVMVLFESADPSPRGWRQTPTGIALTVDVFGTVFFLLSRYEEIVRHARDGHGRFPATASLATAGHFLDQPVADENVDLLWAAMHRLWPRLERQHSAFRLRLTHDVDQPWAVLGQPARRVVRSLAADLVLRRDPGLALRRLRAVVDALSGQVANDPLDRFGSFMDVSERHGLRSTFYFQAGGRPSDFDFRYDPSDPPLQQLLRRIHDRGHEVGLHASYVSHLSADRTAAEFAALVAACDQAGFTQPKWGIRQHFLRFENPATWRIHESSGLAYDSTLCFAEQVGFRAGTCREFPVFDLVGRRALTLRERPLLVMDTTLVGYLGLDLDDATRRIEAIVEECRIHEGDAVLLYHNNTLPGDRFERHYLELVDSLLG